MNNTELSISSIIDHFFKESLKSEDPLLFDYIENKKNIDFKDVNIKKMKKEMQLLTHNKKISTVMKNDVLSIVIENQNDNFGIQKLTLNVKPNEILNLSTFIFKYKTENFNIEILTLGDKALRFKLDSLDKQAIIFYNKMGLSTVAPKTLDLTQKELSCSTYKHFAMIEVFRDFSLIENPQLHFSVLNDILFDSNIKKENKDISNLLHDINIECFQEMVIKKMKSPGLNYAKT